jgi:hypothetical protein
VRAADSGRFDFARSSVARVKELFFLLTKTYIEVGNLEVIFLADRRRRISSGYAVIQALVASGWRRRVTSTSGAYIITSDVRYWEA